MTFLISCPVCYEGGVAIEINDSSLELVERRFQHKDHYFYLDLPYNYVTVDFVDGNILREQKCREAKMFSDRTVNFLARKLRLKGATELDRGSKVRTRIRKTMEKIEDKDVSWSERLRVGLELEVSKCRLSKEERYLLEDLLWDEGFSFDGRELVSRLIPIKDFTMKSRSLYVQRLKALYREFREVYTHVYIVLLCVVSKEAHTQGIIHGILAWFILTHDQEFILDEYKVEGMRFSLQTRLYQLENLNELLSTIEIPGILGLSEKALYMHKHPAVDEMMPGCKLFSLCSSFPRNNWSDANPERNLPKKLKTYFDSQKRGTAGYGIALKIQSSIWELLGFLGIDTIRELSQGVDKFYEFGEFTQRLLGDNYELGHGAICYVQAPYWIRFVESQFSVDDVVTIRWSCPKASLKVLTPFLRAKTKDGWGTYPIAGSHKKSEGSYYLVSSEFIVPDHKQAKVFEFVVVNEVAYVVNPRKPYLLNISFGPPSKDKDSVTEVIVSQPHEDKGITQLLLGIKKDLSDHDQDMKDEHKTLEVLFKSELGLLKAAAEKCDTNLQEIMNRLESDSEDAVYIRRMLQVILAESYRVNKQMVGEDGILTNILEKLEKIAADVRPNASLFQKVKTIISGALKVPDAVALVNLIVIIFTHLLSQGATP